MPILPSVLETTIPRDEILSGELSLDLFAAKLRSVVDGNAPTVYQDAELFFSNTYPTNGLKVLIGEVFGRLTGITSGSPVIRLETSFGGGKTHDLIALWHLAKRGRTIADLERFVPDLSGIPVQGVQVAAVDGRDLDPINGIFHRDSGITTYTLWGEIAYQVGGIEGYQLLRNSDEQKISPGTSVLERLIQGRPTLIILDEIARHLRTARATPVANSTLSEQVVAFLFSLMDLAAASNSLVFVYSLASAADTFADETTDLQELIQASARQERVLSPSSDVEIYNIVKQRLFLSVSQEAAHRAGQEYLHALRTSRLALPEVCKEASYADQIKSSYPFHPELFGLLTKKVASISEFQRTRGALRLFAMLVRHLWRERPDGLTMIHPHHVPIGNNDEITSELTSRLQRPLMLLPVQADIYNRDGKEAHAQVKDHEWLAAGKPPLSSWIGRTIFLHSLTQGITSGIRRPELNLSLLTPQLDVGLVDRALDSLAAVAWYLDNDPITSIARFKEEPSINKIIAEEKDQVGVIQAKEELRTRRDTIFAKKFFNLVTAPTGPQDVDDDPNTVVLCLLDFDDVKINAANDIAPLILEQIFNNTGEVNKFRIFRNRILFLCANRQELERAIDKTREFLAIKNILANANRLDDLSESQQKALRQKEGETDLAVRVSLTNTYRHLFYPSDDKVKAPTGLMHYPLPAQDASDIRGRSNQQEVILKALRECQKVRQADSPHFAPAFILQRVWPAGKSNLTTKELREAFAKNPHLNILLDNENDKLKETIKTGIQRGDWDLKVGEKLFIKPDQGNVSPPDTIEFSEQMELYRRGILKPPEPRQVELSAQVMPSGNSEKLVRVRWRAIGALRVFLYQGERLVPGEFLPSDEVEVKIQNPTLFRLVADYGNGEQQEAQERVNYSSPYPVPGGTNSPSAGTSPGIFEVKPTTLETSGTVDGALQKLQDSCSDLKVRGIQSLVLSVDQVMDYRKLGTTVPLLTQFKFQIDQTVTIQTGEQFLRLEYQGDVKGFSSFKTPTDTLLNSPNVQADVQLKLRFEFNPDVSPTGEQMRKIQEILKRNPVQTINMRAEVVY